MRFRNVLALAGTLIPAACSGGSTVAVATCGPPQPQPASIVALVYPGSGNAAPDAPGELVTQGTLSTHFGPATFTVTGPNGTVASGTPAAAASPLPSPLATPANVSGAPYEALALPKLAAATTYTVTATTYTWGGDPNSSPPCASPQSTVLGTFTTR